MPLACKGPGNDFCHNLAAISVLAGVSGGRSISVHGTQQPIVTDRKPKTIRKSRRRTTTQCKSQMANQAV